MLHKPDHGALELAVQSLDVSNWIEEAECSCLQPGYISRAS